jgi:hypothetical protein
MDGPVKTEDGLNLGPSRWRRPLGWGVADRGSGQIQQAETVVVGVVARRILQQRIRAGLRQREQAHVRIGIAVDENDPPPAGLSNCTLMGSESASSAS